MKTGKTKIQQRRPEGALRKGLLESLPTSVQKSYFILGDKERDVLNRALEKYRPGRSEPILIGNGKLLKPALQLMNAFRLRIDAVEEDVVPVTHLARIKGRVAGACCQKPGNIGLRFQYFIRLYAWAKKHASVGKKRILLEDLRKVLGLEPLKDGEILPSKSRICYFAPIFANAPFKAS